MGVSLFLNELETPLAQANPNVTTIWPADQRLGLVNLGDVGALGAEVGDQIFGISQRRTRCGWRPAFLNRPPG
jgi:hypothetical protein